MEIIPAIDLMDGRCVRLSQGDFSRQTVYSDNPLQTAKEFEAAGLSRLHIVDLDGARSGRLHNLPVVEAIARNTGLVIDFGGGIKTDEDISSVFAAGAAIAGIGSVALRSPDRFFEWLDKYGGDKILLGADVKNGDLFADGWQTGMGIPFLPFLADVFSRGARQVFVTDIARDGLLEGPSVDLYKEIRDAIPGLDLIASGGVSGMQDIEDLERIGCKGVIVGKAIYEGKLELQDLAKRSRAAGPQI